MGFLKPPFLSAFTGAGRRLAAGLFCLSFLFLGCLSRPSAAGPPAAEEPQNRIGSFPEEGRLVFVGVAGVRSRREESVERALEEAAKKVSIFERVEGTIYSYSSRGGGFLDYRSETTSFLNYNRSYKDYIEKLEYDPDTDVFQHENTVFVRTRYKGSLSLSYQSPPSGPGGRPGWVDNPPEAISGYAAGVGYAGRRDAHRDTVIASYENAILAIIQNQSANVRSASEEFRGSGFLDYSAVTQRGISAEGVLTGFYVLETWTDPAARAVWTLAVARPD
ncbi:MAG: hypothetical protein LBS57_04440 [Treponema sp.]|nr:hypothetical protein [Treponema sp.]